MKYFCDAQHFLEIQQALNNTEVLWYYQSLMYHWVVQLLNHTVVNFHILNTIR